ncbi:hypothetical protein [Nannocystis punicea]|uniref:Adhesin domain-containing protein n=1 Tax=Nannocystis punicea TaxID=2995304 RepID=A0ABY7H8B6_9BACT|nr:hypothetical protein [Nannocystis poenicansa]WAS95491.1 hypothetical protein O0S08_04960 [Nannocystis poenicansa]
MPSRAAPVRLLALLAAAPLLMATNRCGVYIEQTENLQFFEPVTRVAFDVHHGSITGTMYPRPSVYIKRHTSGFEAGVGEFGHAVEGDEMQLTGHCAIAHECWYDHMIEAPPGTSLSFTFRDGYIELSEFDAEIHAEVGVGRFIGWAIAAPIVDLSYETGDVAIEFAATPEQVTIAVGTGDVTLTLPAGPYRCEVAPAAKLEGITCDEAATAVLDITVETGAVTLRGV